jgi:uncharacterized repeat protein (TIGR01451 family)
MTRGLGRRRIALAGIAVAAGMVALPATGLAGQGGPEATDLAIVKTSAAYDYAPGDTIEYTVVVKNNGPASVDVSAIQVTDPNVALTLTAPNPAPQVLDPGDALTYTGSHLVTTADCGTLSNTATVALIDTTSTATSTPRTTSTRTS